MANIKEAATNSQQSSRALIIDSLETDPSLNEEKKLIPLLMKEETVAKRKNTMLNKSTNRQTKKFVILCMKDFEDNVFSFFAIVF